MCKTTAHKIITRQIFWNCFPLIPILVLSLLQYRWANIGIDLVSESIIEKNACLHFPNALTFYLSFSSSKNEDK